MTELTIAVVIVEIVREGYVCVDAISNNRSRPTFVEAGETTLAFRVWGREVDATAPHRRIGGESDTTLTIVVDSTIEMIYHTIMLHHITFMSEHLVVFLRGPNQVLTFPALPVNQVTTDGKGIVGIVFP